MSIARRQEMYVFTGSGREAEERFGLRGRLLCVVCHDERAAYYDAFPTRLAEDEDFLQQDLLPVRCGGCAEVLFAGDTEKQDEAREAGEEDVLNWTFPDVRAASVSSILALLGKLDLEEPGATLDEPAHIELEGQEDGDTLYAVTVTLRVLARNERERRERQDGALRVIAAALEVDPPGLEELVGLPAGTAFADSITRETVLTDRFCVQVRPSEHRRDAFQVEVHPVAMAKTRIADPIGRPRTVYYDRKLSQLRGGEVRPRQSNGWTAELPLQRQDGFMYRGMSGAELRWAKAHGVIASRGEYNVGGAAQEGTTSWSTNPQQAANYATWFAPWHLEPTTEDPSYIVVAKRGDLPTSTVAGDTEIDAPPISLRDVVDIIEARPWMTLPGDLELVPVDAFRPQSGLMLTGSSPRSQYMYRRRPLTELLGP